MILLIKSRKRIHIAIFCVIAVLWLGLFALSKTNATWNGEPADSFSGGNGTEASPYEIGSAGELKLFATLINSPDTNEQYRELHYKLVSDIDLQDCEWEPIGIGVYISSPREEIGVYPFYGVFDGGGRTVSSFRITGTKRITWKKYEIKLSEDGKEMYTEDGMPIYQEQTDSFGNIQYDESGNPIYKSRTRTDYIYLGLFGFNQGVIKNLYVSDASITSYWGASIEGILCGANLKRVMKRGVYNNGTYSRTQTSYYTETGIIENCHVLSGDITVTSASTAGNASNGNYTIVGGAVGLNKVGEISFSSANVVIDSSTIGNDTYFGGFVGKCENTSNLQSSVSYCSSQSSVSLNCANKSQAMQFAGGFVGHGAGEYKNCYATGEVSVVGGGTMTIVASGGFMGDCNSGFVTARKCFATGDVSASMIYGGGFSSVTSGIFNGYWNASTLDFCFGFGNVTVENDFPENVNPEKGGAAFNGHFYDSRRHTLGFYHTDSIVTENGSVIDSQNGTRAQIYISTSNGQEKFEEYFARMIESAPAKRPWVFSDMDANRLIFEGEDFTIDSLGKYLSYNGTDDVAIIPLGTLSVDCNAFDGYTDDSLKRILIPKGIKAEDVVSLLYNFPKSALMLGEFSDYIERLNIFADGDFFVKSGGAIMLYIGREGEVTFIPDTARQFSLQSGVNKVFNLATPSCMYIPEAFKADYLTYLVGKPISLHFAEYCVDMIDTCEENGLEYTIIGDINQDGAISLGDVSSLMKHLTHDTYGEMCCDIVCDVLRDGIINSEDLQLYIRYFAGCNVFIGE